jgi:hypothetical protein
VLDGVTGVLNDHLGVACLQALTLNRDDIRQHAMAHGWHLIAQELLRLMVPADPSRSVDDLGVHIPHAAEAGAPPSDGAPRMAIPA